MLALCDTKFFANSSHWHRNKVYNCHFTLFQTNGLTSMKRKRRGQKYKIPTHKYKNKKII